jgi:hypothetical protein
MSGFCTPDEDFFPTRKTQIVSHNELAQLATEMANAKPQKHRAPDVFATSRSNDRRKTN